MKLVKRIGIVLAVLLALYAVAGFLVVPWAAERYLPQMLRERLDRPVAIGAVRVNPFLLTVEARDFSIGGRDGKPAIAFGRLFADLSIASLARRAWTLADVRVEGLQVDAVLDRRGTLDLAEIARRLGGPPGTPDRPPTAVVLARVVVPDASLRFTDLSGAQPASIAIGPVDLRASDLSTTGGEGRVTLHASLPEGASLAASTTLRLQPLQAAGELRLAAFKVATAWPFARDKLRLARLEGTVDLQTRFRFAGAPKTAFELHDLALELTQALAQRPGEDEPLFALRRVAVTGASLDLDARRAGAGKLVAEHGSLRALIEADGTSNWQSIVAAPDAAASPSPARAPAGRAAWQASVDAFVLTDLALRLVDRSRPGPLVADARIASAGGRLAMEFGGARPQVQVAGLAMNLNALALTSARRDAPLLRLQSVVLADARFDLAERQVALGRLAVEGGQVSIVRTRDGSIEPLATLAATAAGARKPHPGEAAARDAAPPAAEGTGTPAAGGGWRYALGEGRLGSFDVALADRTVTPAVAYDLQVTDLAVKGGNTGPDPMHFDAAVAVRQGGRVAASATFHPDSGAVQAAIDVKEFATAPLRPLVARLTGLQVRTGPVSASTRLHYARGAQSRLPSLDALALRVPQLVVTKPGARQPMLALQTLEAGGGRVDIAQRQASFAQVGLHRGELRAEIGKEGRPDRQPQAPSGGRPDAAAETAGRGGSKPGSAGWQARIASMRVDRVGVRFADRNRSEPMVAQVGRIDGNLQLRLATGATPQVLAESIDLQLRQLALGSTRPEDARAVRLAGATIRQGVFDLAGRRLKAEAIALRGGGTDIVLRADGSIAPLDLYAATGAGGPAPPGPRSGDRATAGTAGRAAARTASAERAWRYDIGRIGLSGFDVALSDRRFAPPLAYPLQVRDAQLRNVRSGAAAPMPFEASLAVGSQGQGQGRLKASGTIASDAGAARARVSLEGVAIAPLQPLLDRHAALVLRSGTLAAQLDVRYERRAAKPVLDATGGVRIADLRVDEAATSDRFLAWQSLDAQGIDFGLARGELRVREVTIERPEAKILIDRQRRVNLAQVLRKAPAKEPVADGIAPGDAAPAGTAPDDAAPEPAAAASARPADPAGAPEPTATRPDFRVVVERVRLRRGEVDYADLSLVLPFSTRVTAFNGTIVGISNDPARRAQVQARGSIGPYGSASVSGTLIPVQPSRYLDLHVLFNNVLVPPLSPYTATFAGRTVESGKLWLDLDYKIVEGDLLGKNEIRLADFTLGERVEAPNALNVPLDLAVALLTDSKGEIHLSVPVRGDLDNPRFSVGSAITQALGNVLKRIVGAPFRALAGLFGQDRQGSLATIDFEPGSARLRPEQREKLDALTRALQERPRLNLLVTAPYERGADGDALRREQARRDLARRLGRRLEPGEGPGPIAYDDPDTQRALRQMLAQQAGENAVAGLQRQHAGAGDPAALYGAVFDAIVAGYELPQSALQVLAAQRAQRITGYLGQHGVDPSRLQTGAIQAIDTGTKNVVGARLEVTSGGPAG